VKSQFHDSPSALKRCPNAIERGRYHIAKEACGGVVLETVAAVVLGEENGYCGREPETAIKPQAIGR
jgi:hypothetical protein